MHDVIRHHIPQGACIVEISAAQFDANGLGIRDLNVIDVAPVPDGLEDGIVEAKNHDVLHRLFTQVMIDAIDLVFRQHRFDVAVQSLGRIEIVPKGFFDDNSPPVFFILIGEAGFAQLLNNRREKLGCGREIKQIICFRPILLINFGKPGRQGRIGHRVGEIAPLIVEALGKPLPGFGAAVASLQKASDLVAKFFQAEIVE